MASDRKQFERAYARWENLLRAEAFSVPEEEGITVVASSDYPFNFKRHGNDGIDADDENIAEFENEATYICERLGAIGLKTDLVVGVKAEDMIDVLADEEVSNIMVIGHGSISDIYIEGARNGRFDWRDVSEHATHLKLGTFTQRQCGIFKRRLNIPLGYFAVSRPEAVRASFGAAFTPVGPHDSRGIAPVTDYDPPRTYQDALDYFTL